MIAIHAAVVDGGGTDFYTGEPLAWEQISTYRNDASKSGRRAYKRELAMLPTVDHVGDGLGPADFKICSWRTNDCKNDLTHRELVAFSQLVLAHHQRGSSADSAKVIDNSIGETGNITIEEFNLGRIEQIYEV
jgi:hypothetical protein